MFHRNGGWEDHGRQNLVKQYFENRTRMCCVWLCGALVRAGARRGRGGSPRSRRLVEMAQTGDKPRGDVVAVCGARVRAACPRSAWTTRAITLSSFRSIGARVAHISTSPTTAIFLFVRRRADAWTRMTLPRAKPCAPCALREAGGIRMRTQLCRRRVEMMTLRTRVVGTGD